MSDNQSEDPHQMVFMTNAVLLDRYKMMIWILGASVLLAIGSLALNFVLVSQRPEPKYFLTDGQGRLRELVPLNQPNTSKQAVTNFATEAVLAVNSIDFANITKQFSDAKRYFTQNGWTEFFGQFQSQGNLEALQTGLFVVTSGVTAPPNLDTEGEMLGRHYWDVEIPITVRWRSEKVNRVYAMNVRVRVVRVPETESETGIAVARMIFTQT